jgi:phosphate transport system protein
MTPNHRPAMGENLTERSLADPRLRTSTAVTPRKKVRSHHGQDELTKLALKACLIARDAAYNVRDLLTNSSQMAFLAVRECEKELDQIERHIDERMPSAITRVGEVKARELLACLKFITDLERIGDLLMGVAQRLHSRPSRLTSADSRLLVEMCSTLHSMLERVHEGFLKRQVECARYVLHADAGIDRICHSVFQNHLAGNAAERDVTAFDVVLMAQAFERAGDHTKNLAEELYSLIEGHTLRHPPKRKPSQN